MGLDESLTQAFETIQEATCFDAFSNIPHVENLRYQSIEEGRAMRQLGMNLTAIVGDQDCEDLQYAAHCIRRYFGSSLPMEPMPEFIADAPRFLLEKLMPIATMGRSSVVYFAAKSLSIICCKASSAV